MKKHLLRSSLTLLLAVLLVTWMPLTAQAGPIEITYKVRIADGIDEEIHSPDGSWIDDVRVVSGELPYGVAIGCHEDIMYIIGVPAFVGNYEARVDMEIGGGAYQYLIRIIVYDPNAPVTITKHPTGETVTEGDNALFIARADNATQIVWRLVSPDSATTIECSVASSYFPGLQVVGLGTETLTLLNIPYSLDGWKVEAKFFGNGGPVFSNGAKLTVLRAKLDPPVIKTQPVGADIPSGQSYTLSVLATAAEGSLRYQWYRSEGGASTGSPVAGATGPSLTVTEQDGGGTYFVRVWCEDGDRSSETTVSDTAVLRFLPPPTTLPPSSPPPVITPEPSDLPSAPLPSADGVKPDSESQPEPVPSPSEPQNQGQNQLQRTDNTRLYLLVGLAAAFALLLISLIVIILRLKNRYR